MSKIRCTNCGKKIPYAGKVCPYCGADKTQAKKNSNILTIVVVVVMVSFVVYKCSGDTDSESTSNNKEQTIKNSLPSYSVIKGKPIGDNKYSFDISLEKRLNKSELESIAKYLKGGAKGYDNVFISYYLPGMEVDAGAWATSHFTPNLEVKIIGRTIEDYNTIKKSNPITNEETIGSWYASQVMMGTKFTISKNGQKYYLITYFNDGGESKSLLSRKVIKSGTRFEEVGNEFGEYYLVKPSGELWVMDSNGLIGKGEKI